MAIKSNEPYIELHRRLLKTASYERHIATLKESFESRGIETDVFKSNLLHQFVLCMWTARRRKQLLKRAMKYEAVLVLGCEAAVETVRSCLRSTSCQVIQGMKAEGIMSIQPRFSLPFEIALELEGVTPYINPSAQSSEPEPGGKKGSAIVNDPVIS
jgi:hypothetical protein